MKNDAKGGDVAPAEKTNATSASIENALEMIVVAGMCEGFFRYGDVEKEFSGNHVVLVRPAGSIIVHSAQKGIKPVCYIDDGADIAIARNMADAEIEVSALAKDGREILVTFSRVEGMHGIHVPVEALGMEQAVLQCVKQANGRYGKTTIARILTGSASRRILSLRLWTIGLYGALSRKPLKEVIGCIEELIELRFLDVRENDGYPTLGITEDGLEAIRTLSNAPGEPLCSEEILRALREWRDAKAGTRPKYLVMENRTLREIAAKRPTSAYELSRIYGIGEARLTSYGTEILEIVDRSSLS
ncbi:MAG: HRDC domain-containing protein [Candidatus Thermoplasmatota archaeon]